MMNFLKRRYLLQKKEFASIYMPNEKCLQCQIICKLFMCTFNHLFLRLQKVNEECRAIYKSFPYIKSPLSFSSERVTCILHFVKIIYIIYMIYVLKDTIHLVILSPSPILTPQIFFISENRPS